MTELARATASPTGAVSRDLALAAAQAGDGPALCGGFGVVSYAELARRQRQALGAFAAAGWPRTIALVHERTPDAIAAVLAALESGATLVPIDAGLPDARIETILGDARPELVVTEIAGRFETRSPRTLSSLFEVGNGDVEPPREAVERPALVLYTSGTTGTPKSVPWSRPDFTRAIWASTSNLALTGHEVWLCRSNGGLVDQYDELMGGLLRGRPVVLASRDEVGDPRRLVGRMAEFGVTRLMIVPSYLRLLLQSVPDAGERLPLLRDWLTTGEPQGPSLVALFAARLPDRRLWDFFSTTEEWPIACARVDLSDPAVFVPRLGTPCPGVDLDAVDDSGASVAVGATGWLAIRLPWISERSRAALRDGRSRTGDVVRRRSDGTFELLGRGDGQLKIHGLRIDPAEVESAIGRHPDVLEAAVTTWRGADERDHLVAHVVARPGRAMPPARVLERLLERDLPPASIPSHFQPIAVLARNSGGKLDRRNLPPPRFEGEATASAAETEPPTPFELEVAAVLARALGGERPAIDDDLRRRGLDSLGVIAAAVALDEAFGVDLAGRELMAMRSAREIAALVRERQGVGAVAERTERADGAEPVATATASVMAIDWEAGGVDPAWNIVERFELAGEIDADRLEKAARALVARHAALRSRFDRRDGEFERRVAEDALVELRRHPDSPGEAEAEDRIAAILAERSAERFGWQEVPRVRFDLVPRGVRRATLVITVDHLVSDEESLRILGRDLFELERALAEGAPPQLPPLALTRPPRRGASDLARIAAAEARLRRSCALARDTPLLSPRRREALARPGTIRAREAEVSPAELSLLARRAAELGTTVHALLLAAAAVVRWSEERLANVPVSTVLAGRDDPRDREAVGLFDRLALVFVEGVGPAMKLRALVGEVDRQLRLGWRDQDADTVGVLWREDALPLIRACRVNYYLRNLELGIAPGRGLEIERRPVLEPQTLDEWSMQIAGSDHLLLRLEGQEELLSEERATRTLDLYGAVLRALVDGGDTTLGAIVDAFPPISKS